jgi:hypothetical protein
VPYRNYVAFEVLTAVVMKSSIFWDITPCSPLKVNRSFGETSNSSPACHLLSLWFLARLILQPRRWGRRVPLKRRFTFNWLHDVISQKIELFTIGTRMRIGRSEKRFDSRLGQRPTMPPIQWVPGALLKMVKQPGLHGDQSYSPSSAEVNASNYTSTLLYVFLA